MPTRVIQTGLPGVTFDDSNASHWIPAVAQASGTLLELGPKLAQIRMQQQANERDYGLQQQQLGLAQRRAGQEDTRIGYEGQRTQADVDRMRAQTQGENFHNVLGVYSAGGAPAQSMLDNSGIDPSSVAGIVSQADNTRAMQTEEQLAKREHLGAQTDLTRANEEYVREDKARIQQAGIEAKSEAAQERAALTRSSQEQSLRKAAQAAVNKKIGSVMSEETKRISALNAQDKTGALAKKYTDTLVEQEMARLDPTYIQRKQAAALQTLNALGPK